MALQFLLFSGDNYYPSGGWSDYVGAFKTASEAQAKAIIAQPDWVQIVDIEKDKIVLEGYRREPRHVNDRDGPLEWKDGS